VALDDVVAEDPRLALLGHVDVVKIDFADTSDAQRRALLGRCRDAGVQVLAEKVETPAQHAEARRLGCDLFQGYFFQKPAIVGARQRAGTRLAHLQLLRSATSRQIDRDAVGNVLARDRYAARRFGDIVEVEHGDVGWQPSVRAVLDRLDDEQLMRAITLLVVLWLGESHPRPLRETALIRARFCEQLTALVGGDSQPVDAWDGYLAGCCSLLDALVDEPLADVLERIQLPEHLIDACLRDAGTTGSVLALVRAYEHGRWADVLRRAAALGVAGVRLGPLYLGCLSQVRTLLGRLEAAASSS
jgi:EAL and modified HD-GYP domain-containing signal transduction protein